MINIHPIRGISHKNLAIISRFNHEPLWLFKRREMAHQNFVARSARELPTPLQNIEFADLKVYLKAGQKQIRGVRPVDAAGFLKMCDSTCEKTCLRDSLREKNVLLLSLAQARRNKTELVDKYFTRLYELSDTANADLNLAMHSSGAFLFIPPRQKINLPIILLSKIFARGLCQLRRNLLIVNEQASCHVVDMPSATPWSEKNNLASCVTEIFLEKHAVCQFDFKPQYTNNVLNFYDLKARLAEGARLILNFNNSCEIAAEVNLGIVLHGRASQVQINSQIEGSDSQVLNERIKIHHAADATGAVFNLRTFANKNAQVRRQLNVNARPFSKKIVSQANVVSGVFSDQAKVCLLPEFEISSSDNNVNCHMQNISVTESQKEFLNSRGLNAENISKLIMEFAKQNMIE